MLANIQLVSAASVSINRAAALAAGVRGGCFSTQLTCCVTTPRPRYQIFDEIKSKLQRLLSCLRVKLSNELNGNVVQPTGSETSNMVSSKPACNNDGNTILTATSFWVQLPNETVENVRLNRKW